MIDGDEGSHHSGHTAPPSTSRDSKRIKSVSTSSSTSLPEDVKAIQLALEGASASAKDATLKVLSKLIQRLEQAELDRDNAICELLCSITAPVHLSLLLSKSVVLLVFLFAGEVNEYSKRCKYLESELDKKRAELRELLMQDSSASAVDTSPEGRLKRHLACDEASSQRSNPGPPPPLALIETVSTASGAVSSYTPTDLRTATMAEEEEEQEPEPDYPPFPKRHRINHHLKESQQAETSNQPQLQPPKSNSSIGASTSLPTMSNEAPPPLTPTATAPPPSERVSCQDKTGGVKPELICMPNQAEVMMPRRASSGTPVSIKSRVCKNVAVFCIVHARHLRCFFSCRSLKT